MISDLQQIDRAVYVALENQAISVGLYPDVTTMLLPNGKLNKTLFDNAINAIIAAGKTPVFVYGVSAPRDRLSNHRVDIYIDRQYLTPGQKGTPATYLKDETPSEEPKDKIYTRLRPLDRYTDIQYRVRYICNSSEGHRNAEQILHIALGNHRSLVAIGDQREELTEAPNIEIQMNGVPVDVGNSEMIERVYRYIVQQVIIYEGDVIETNIVANKEIKGVISPQNNENLDSNNENINVDVP